MLEAHETDLIMERNSYLLTETKKNPKTIKPFQYFSLFYKAKAKSLLSPNLLLFVMFFVALALFSEEIFIVAASSLFL